MPRSVTSRKASSTPPMSRSPRTSRKTPSPSRMSQSPKAGTSKKTPPSTSQSQSPSPPSLNSVNLPSTPPLAVQKRVHLLNDGEHLKSTIFRLKKGWTIQFKLGPTLFGKKVKLFFNYPKNTGETFKRHQYRELRWKSGSLNRGDDTSLYSEVIFWMAGSFHYYFTYEGSESEEPTGSGYFLVDPEIRYGPDDGDEILPLDCIQCQTYLAKCLGTFDQWESRLRVGKESGYNMFHLSPIQELGGSRSAYCLKNQLKLNSMFNTPKRMYNMKEVGGLVSMMKRQWKVVTITDVVLNHTANESPWLEEHPECAYNLENSPHLRPAYLLDRVIWHLSLEIIEGKWEFSGISSVITEEKHLDVIRDIMHGYLFPQIKLHDFYMVDVESLVDRFDKAVIALGLPIVRSDEGDDKQLKIIQDPEYRRLQNTIDFELGLLLYNTLRQDAYTEIERRTMCSEAFQRTLEDLNKKILGEIQSHLSKAVENVISAVRYERLNPDGPKLGPLSKKHPLVPRYFTHFGPDTALEEEEQLMYGPNAKFLMAHNGWVMGDNPLRNFAEPGSNVYIRRELLVWGDNVKLRYGESPEDCPFLWDHMKEYVRLMAMIFHGLRLDNCHSTPIHVAEYMMDAAREVRPDLYLVAELFTSDEAIDNIFVNRLGISSLIREAMSAHDSHELGRLVFRYGGEPVGAFIQPPVRPLTPSIAHAVFLDLTHDNPSPVEKRCVYDLLPSTALVSMACCATGSNRGYDELIPHHIHVVKETRRYPGWSDGALNIHESLVSINSGIIAARKALNKLHFELGEGGYTQVFVDQRDENIVAVTRHCFATHQSVILVARTAFDPPNNPTDTGYIPPLCVQGVLQEIILEARLIPKGHNSSNIPSGWKKHERYLNGLTDFQLDMREHIQPYESQMVEVIFSGKKAEREIHFTDFPPSAVVAFRFSLNSGARDSILTIRTCIAQFGYCVRTYSGNVLLPRQATDDFESIVSRLTLTDLNRALFRCDPEEKDDYKGGGSYNIPEYGNLIYCGLQGLMSELEDIHLKNDLGHPLCKNLRDGDWLPNYTANRLMQHPSTKDLGLWFHNVFSQFGQIPNYLVPCYFDTIITGAYNTLLSAVWRNMSQFVSEGSAFVKALALASVALGSVVKSSPLPALSPRLAKPHPPVSLNRDTGKKEQSCVTLAAGLPHFATGYMRNWGRDTFISLKGLFLIPGRYQESRFIILAYAGCLRHGLIPNLLDKGTHARYNCRDAVWWWLQCIQEYTLMVPGGSAILKDVVSRLYPTDDSQPERPGAHDQPLHDVIQEALQCHFQRLQFRERNSGPDLDSQMLREGFNSNIGVDLETGFVFGGNVYNCGTWMDKMGSSEEAGNKGKPATPRDGSAVELVGLCKSALRWLNIMYKEGHYPYNSVQKHEIGRTITMTFEEWEELLIQNFEKYFWIDTKPNPLTEKNPELINRRGIYKDCFKASQFWADYQLRPNFTVAMVVAPELFTSERAWTALQNAEEILLGPLGMKTLDPSDWAYCGVYDNSNDSSDEKVAKGFNYHQGPEWLWLLGYFLRAKTRFAFIFGGKTELEKAIMFTKSILAQHYKEVIKSQWKGLPELTNKDGEFCPDSCPIQAWSHACLLEVLYDLDRISNAELPSSLIDEDTS